MCGDIVLRTNSESFRQKIITPPTPTYIVRFVSFSFGVGGSPGQRVPAVVMTRPCRACRTQVWINSICLGWQFFFFFKRIKLCGNSKKRSLFSIFGNSESQ